MRRHLSLLIGFAVLALAIVASLWLARAWANWQGGTPPPWLTAGVAGMLAMSMGWRILPSWWRGVLLLAPLVMWGGLRLHPGWFLAAAVMLLLIQFNALRHRVPLYRSGTAVIDALEREIRTHDIRHLADMGCGDGHLIAALARRLPGVRFTGYETAPLLFLVARWRCGRQPNCRVAFRDFWREDWRDFDAVFCFLSPEPMLRIWRKVQRDVPEGGALYSLAFEVPGVEAEALLGAGRFDLHRYPRLPRQPPIPDAPESETC